MNKLDAIFSPQSVAVIGASSTPGKVGHDIFANILRGGFKGVLYPVNPTARSILSVKAYPSVTDIPDPVDLAMIILPPKLARTAVADAIQKGVKGIVIVSAGFREVGKAGRDIEDQIVEMCRKADIRLIGPNCLGVINPLTSVSLNASFSSRMPKAGNISFISQSGALCTAVLDFAADRDFGFSKFISIGNKADVDELDLLRYFHRDFDTEVIMIYLEELRRGPEFIEEVKKITSGDRPTPILVIKSGRTAAGAQAAASHTGSLAGSEAVYDSIFEQAGIIRVDSINDLFDFASTFAYKNESMLGKFRRKIPEGNRVAIVTNAGGPGIVATDMTISSGLQLAEFKEDTIETLASHLPAAANLHNPVDVIGDAAQDRYENALAAVIRDEGVDGALVILTPQSMTNALGTAEAVVSIARRTHKPILCCFMGIVDVSSGVKHLQENGIPVFRFPEAAARAFGTLYRYSQWLNRQSLAQFTLSHDVAGARDIINDCLERGRTRLGEFEGLRLLACYGFDVLPTELAATDAEAVAAADRIGYPVVLKIVSPQILHKSDAGGVKIGMKDAAAVRKAFNQIVEGARKYRADAEIEGVLVQKMAEPGREVILGANRYPVFGPLIMFGFGGIFVEVFKDVSFRLAPIGRNEARRMMRKIMGYKLLRAFRGRPESDLATVERLLVSLSDMVVNHSEIQELDINPLLVHEQGRGATVADCRMILKAADGVVA
ncbi:acetate--CoA ligase family protein [Desulfococcus multivorans]|uniref:CoA-binding domain protein n=2 Tax=Desulfococcus TaxID=896 RepID=S7UPA5_DESML|nr:acetate--CoA ligase [Desulfococcus multivorans]AOY59507.1 CoA-binding domain protein [Desulfococcus multivorans]AQV01704.1 acyl-CoA synthetase [Desulfococcus multivorans]EPR34153.1 CoA-binding domain protein [Desulfococcus multivorans DSM 2059]SKA19504.1 acetyltransferase [Desulfococcus multivorans DSM 2059]